MQCFFLKTSKSVSVFIPILFSVFVTCTLTLFHLCFQMLDLQLSKVIIVYDIYLLTKTVKIFNLISSHLTFSSIAYRLYLNQNYILMDHKNIDILYTVLYNDIYK